MRRDEPRPRPDGGHAWTDLDRAPKPVYASFSMTPSERCTIGSMNFDNRSMALNDESTPMILDPTIGRQMDQMLLDDLRHAEEVTLTTFQQRSWWARFTERAANLVMRLL